MSSCRVIDGQTIRACARPRFRQVGKRRRRRDESCRPRWTVLRGAPFVRARSQGDSRIPRKTERHTRADDISRSSIRTRHVGDDMHGALVGPGGAFRRWNRSPTHRRNEPHAVLGSMTRGRAGPGCGRLTRMRPTYESCTARKPSAINDLARTFSPACLSFQGCRETGTDSDAIRIRVVVGWQSGPIALIDPNPTYKPTQ